MKIIPKSVVKDGGQVYEPDVDYDVDDEVGRRFVILGWATSPDYSPAGVPATPASVDLAPDSVRHSTAATEV